MVHEKHMDLVAHTSNDNDDLNLVDVFCSLGNKNDPLTWPTQVPQPSWILEAMMNLNRNISTTTNDEILNIPSQSVVMHDEIVHFYVDDGSIEEPNINNEEVAEEDNVVETPLLASPQPLPRNTPRLRQFLKFFSGERVNARKTRNNRHSLVGLRFIATHFRRLPQRFG